MPIVKTPAALAPFVANRAPASIDASTVLAAAPAATPGAVASVAGMRSTKLETGSTSAATASLASANRYTACVGSYEHKVKKTRTWKTWMKTTWHKQL